MEYSFFDDGTIMEGRSATHAEYSGWHHAVYCYDFRVRLMTKVIAVFRLKSLKTK